MARPAVDVVVPFRGSARSLAALRARVARLALRSGDSLVIVDNTPRPAPEAAPASAPAVLGAAARRTPGYARNRGAAAGSAEWLVFLDADTEPAADLLDRYFDPPPASGTGLLAGGVLDEPIPAGGAPAARYAYIRRAMSQDDTFRFGDWGFPKSANVAVRRSAFEAAGGFREDIRAAEDADLSYRLRRAGWEIERRERAVVVHRSRQTVTGFAVQKALHGAGGAWLEREYPGSFPPRRRLGLLWWALRTAVLRLGAAARERDRDRVLWALLDPVEALSWELGRSLPNERPLSGAVWRQALRRARTPRGPRTAHGRG